MIEYRAPMPAAARTLGKSAIRLDVGIDNLRAQRGHARYGFAEIGRCLFPVGDHLDDEKILRLALTPRPATDA